MTAKTEKRIQITISADMKAEIETLFPQAKLNFSEFCRNILMNEIKRVKAVRESKQSNDAKSAVLATIEAMMFQNANATDDNGKIYINLSSVKREYPNYGYVKKDGSKSTTVNVALLTEILASKAEELNAHHSQYGIEENHNLRMRRK